MFQQRTFLSIPVFGAKALVLKFVKDENIVHRFVILSAVSIKSDCLDLKSKFFQ